MKIGPPRNGGPQGNAKKFNRPRSSSTDRDSAQIPIDALRRRAIRPDEIPELRRIWWRLACQGHRLPAELGVIVIEGGRR